MSQSRQSRNNLPQIQIDIAKALSDLIRKTAFNIEAKAKQLCPVDTGMLRNSIQTEVTGPLSATVGTDVEYAPYVELGTRFMKGQPFLTPAFDEEKSRFSKQFIDIKSGLS